jgi:hypothetical protein
MHHSIPSRAETLEILRMMGDFEPILMLASDGEGYGTRWTLHGQELPSPIVRYLMEQDCVADAGITEMGARKLALTPAGAVFRDEGTLWWSELSFLQRIKIRLFG